MHAIVTAGGLATDSSCFNPTSDKYLFPVTVMSALLRGKMLAALRAMHRADGFAGFDDLCDPQAFENLMKRLASKDWVVYAKKPFRRADHVLAYLGRYTHRVDRIVVPIGVMVGDDQALGAGSNRVIHRPLERRVPPTLLDG